MLTRLTQESLAILHDIAAGRNERIEKYNPVEGEIASLLGKLEKAGLIHHAEGNPEGTINSYQLNRPLNRISLLSLLEATGEHLNCNRPTTEEFYNRYGKVAQKLGVVNQLTRSFLEDIKLTDC